MRKMHYFSFVCRCKVEGGEELCDEKANCIFHPGNNT